jgi:ATP/maltotriose-dependent transcriptional regulator MalT
MTLRTAAGKLGADRPPTRLVGRERELGALRDQLQRMLDGQGRLVLVSGEAGIGKTTLVERLSEDAESHGCLVLWGHAYDLSTTPAYGPWLELLRRVPAGKDELPPLPDFVQNTQALAAVSSQDALFAAIAAFFEDVAIQQPLVLVLDDLHWADQGSLDFLRFLARQIGACRILLVATYRSDELHRHHPLYNLLPLVIREAGAERLEVRRLDAAGHRSLIDGRYGLSVEDAVRLQRFLETHAEGNPLFALELLRSLEAEGILRTTDGGWSLGNLGSVRLPSLLRQVIERRLERLDDAARALLQVAAIIGQEVPLDLWQQVSEVNDETLESAIEQGQATHLLDEVAEGASYRFQHALLREALYESVVSLRRRGWHRKIAEALAAGHAAVPDTVAHHFQQSGDVRAVTWLLEAARRARMSFATTTAIERLETALALDEQHDGASGQRGWLLASLGGLGDNFAHVDERLQMLDDAMDIAEQSGDEVLKALVEWYQAIFATGYTASVGALLGNARDCIESLLPSERERLVGFIYGAGSGALDPSGPDIACVVIGFQGQSGQYRDALTGAERLRAEHPKLSASAELGIDNALMACYQALGRPDDALRLYERVLVAHRHERNASWAAVLKWLQLRDLVLVYWPDRMSMRQVVAAESVATIRTAKTEQLLNEAMPDESGIVWLLLLEGQWDAARLVMQLAAGDYWASFLTAAPWMVLSRHQGDPDAGLARLSQVFPDGPASEPGRQTFETSVLCMHPAIEIALDADDLVSAHAWLDCHDRWMAWSGHIPFTTIGHLLWARYHHVAGDRAAARERVEQARALATEPRQPLALLAAERLLGELDTGSRAYTSAQQHLAAALALADACQAPFERALTLAAMAEIAIASGERDAAVAPLAEARAICEPLGAKPTLARLSALEARIATTPRKRYPAGLSAREVEVLRLVSQGLTDAEVAERLYLSPRTVGQHLRSIFNKLGVSSRTAASRFAIEQGLL